MRMSLIGSKYLEILSSVGGAVFGGLRRCSFAGGSTSLWAGLESS